MVLLNEQITVTGASIIEEGESETRIAYMSANVSADGKPSISHVIQDKDAFKANKEEVLKDFSAFDEYVYNLDVSSVTKQ